MFKFSKNVTSSSVNLLVCITFSVASACSSITEGLNEGGSNKTGQLGKPPIEDQKSKKESGFLKFCGKINGIREEKEKSNSLLNENKIPKNPIPPKEGSGFLNFCKTIPKGSVKESAVYKMLHKPINKSPNQEPSALRIFRDFKNIKNIVNETTQNFDEKALEYFDPVTEITHCTFSFINEDPSNKVIVINYPLMKKN